MKYIDTYTVCVICLLLFSGQAVVKGQFERSTDQPWNNLENSDKTKEQYKRWVDVDDEESLVPPDTAKYSQSNKDPTDFTKIVENFNNGLTAKLNSLSTDAISSEQLGEQDDRYIKAAAEQANGHFDGEHIIPSKVSDLDKYAHEIDPDVNNQIKAALAQDGSSPEALNEVNIALSHGLPSPEVLESTNHAIHTENHEGNVQLEPQQIVTHPKPIHKYVGQIIHKVKPSEHRYLPMKHIFLKHVPQILQRLRVRPVRVHRPRIIIVKEPHVQHHHEYCKILFLYTCSLIFYNYQRFSNAN